jgi:transposase
MQAEGNTAKNGEPTVRFSFMKNAPAHQSGLVKNFLANKHLLQTPEHPPYSPDLAPAEFYLFPQ